MNATPLVAPKSLTTLTGVAAWMRVPLLSVLLANADRAGFFAPGPIVTAGATYTPGDKEPLSHIALQFGGMEDFAVALATVDAGASAGSYTLNSNAPPVGLELIPHLSLSAATAPLSSTGSRLTSLFSTKDPAAQSAVPLRLEYQVNQLEFDIHSVAGISGYRGSSWLSFIVPIDNAAGDLGQVMIPVPLRGYPEPVAISHQAATPSAPSSDPSLTVAQWDYSFTSAGRLAAQDELMFDVMFNYGSDASPSVAPPAPGTDRSAVIQVLAAFAAVWPAISPDLALLQEGSTGALPSAAAQALAALADLAQRTQAAWVPNAFTDTPDPNSQGVTFSYQLTTLIDESGGAGGTPIFSDITLLRLDQALDFSTARDDFIFATDGSMAAGLSNKQIGTDLRARFAGYGFTLSADASLSWLLAPSGTDWIVVDTGTPAQSIAPQTYRLTLVTPAGGAAPTLQVGRQIMWPSLQIVVGDKAGPPLAGTLIETRMTFDVSASKLPIDQPLSICFVYPRLSALILQSGWGGSHLSRNVDLVSGSATNGAFILETPLALFPTRITPLLSSSISTALTAADPLASAVRSFFQDVVAAQTATESTPGTTRRMRISATYWESADGTTPADSAALSHRNYLLLVPQVDFNVDTDWQPGAFCDSLAATMLARATALGITPVSSGRWVLEVLVYVYDSDPASVPQGLLSITNSLGPAA